MRVAAQVVVAVSAHLARERLERSLFFRQQRYVVRCRVAAVQAYLGSRVEQRLDETWPELFVGLRRGAVVRVMVPCQHEKGRAACPPPALLGHDLREAPVGIGPAKTVQRGRGKAGRFTQGSTEPPLHDILLQPGGCPAKPDASPAPRRVHIVRKCDGKAGAAPTRRCDPELLPESLERRIERIQ